MDASFFPTREKLADTFKNWIGNSLANQILISFMCEDKEEYIDDAKQKNRKKFKNKITISNQFDEFRLEEKISMNQIYNDLDCNNFLVWYLSKQKLSIEERKGRFKAYKRMLHESINTAIASSRNTTRKLFGFGIYQQKSVITMLDGYGKPFCFKPFVIVPTDEKFFEKIKEHSRYLGDTRTKIIKELINRIDYRKDDAVRRRDMTKEEVQNLILIKKKLKLLLKQKIKVYS